MTAIKVTELMGDGIGPELQESVATIARALPIELEFEQIDWSLAPWLVIGAVFSIPFAAHLVVRISERDLKVGVALAMLALGCGTLIKAVTS